MTREAHFDFSSCTTVAEALAQLREFFADLSVQMDRHAADFLRTQGFPTEDEIASVQLWQRQELEKERRAIERQVVAYFLDPKAEPPAKTLQ